MINGMGSHGGLQYPKGLFNTLRLTVGIDDLQSIHLLDTALSGHVTIPTASSWIRSSSSATASRSPRVAI